MHFAKTGEIGDRDSGYVDEVSWIRPSRYEDKEESIKAEDLLTVEDINALIDRTTNKRDRAMLWVMFEGAFRPGELLHLKVGGVEFRDNYLLLSTHGKTGNKRVALVVSFRPLLEWLAEHPLRDDPKAPLWYSFSSMSKTKSVTYGYLREHLKRCKEKAGIKKKRVWNYLFRHSQLTLLAKKLSDQTLRIRQLETKKSWKKIPKTHKEKKKIAESTVLKIPKPFQPKLTDKEIKARNLFVSDFTKPYRMKIRLEKTTGVVIANEMCKVEFDGNIVSTLSTDANGELEVIIIPRSAGEKKLQVFSEDSTNPIFEEILEIELQ